MCFLRGFRLYLVWVDDRDLHITWSKYFITVLVPPSILDDKQKHFKISKFLVFTLF